MSIRRLGVLTGGGDAPGLNPALKAIVYKASGHGIEVTGLYDGWRGLLNEGCGETLRLEDYMVRRWDRDGGTNLGSSRTNPFRTHLPGDREPRDRSAEVLANMERLHFDAVIALGGGRAATFPALVPVFGVIIGFLALGVVPSPAQFVGMLIVLVGFHVTLRR